MKTQLITISLLTLALGASAANFTPGTNAPPPAVGLAWVGSPDPRCDGYRLYWGPSSGNYTNFLALGNVTNFNFTGMARGAAYFWVVTATSSQGAPESDPSNEVSYTSQSKLSPPGSMKPPVTLVVQSKPASDPQALWADYVTLPIPDDAANQLYRTKLTLAVSSSPGAIVNTSPQVRRVQHASIPLPPAPTKN